jgi:pantetheine-phosphate adenylyltransferase
MMRIAVYPGTFDPITYGHLDIIHRSLGLFDRVVVAVAVAPSLKKRPLFSAKERLEMVKQVTRHLPHVEAALFDGLMVDFVKKVKAHSVIRGLRAVSDMEHEFLMAWMNRKMDSDVETVFLMPSEEYTYLTSSSVKELASLGGELKAFVPDVVAKKLRDRFRRKPA